MALSVNLSLNLTEGSLTESFTRNQTATVSATGYKVQSPTIGTASSAISTATIGTLGYAFLQSLVTTTEATCTITFGKLDTGTLHEVVKLRPGEPAALRLAAGDYAAKAADEGYKLLFAVIED